MSNSLKRLFLLTLVGLIFLSNTGLAYYVHTCIHSGKSNIEWFHLHASHGDDSCDIADKMDCSSEEDDCCFGESNTEKKSCHTHTIEYKKANLLSVKPEIKSQFIGDYMLVYTVIWITFHAFIEPVLIASLVPNFDHHIYDIGTLILSGLEHRISLGSFIC